MPDRPSLSSSISALSLATILSLGGPLAGSSAIAVVSTSSDTGPGSFRDAIATANGNASITQIVFLPSVNTIDLQGTVFFTGWQDLVIDGNNAILDGRNAGGTAFVVSGGGDLSVSDLTVQNAPAEGITYAVPGGATGTLHIVLDNVTIQDNVGHGVWIADQVDNSATEGEQPPDAGSDVSLDVTVIDSRFLDNGNDPDRSESDHDGLRVDEGGNGDLTFTIERSVSDGNGADGIELDERGPGDIHVSMSDSQVTQNGELDEEDLDDGFDIDEWNEGSVFVDITASSASHNWEEGFDFNENNAGDMRVRLTDVDASENREEGIDLEEDDDFAGGGRLETTITNARANGNGVDGGDGGVKIREKGTGELDATLEDVTALNNQINGIHIREDAVGNLDASLTNIVSNANAGDGVVFDERSDGNLTASMTNRTSTGNSDDGVQADEAGAGTGSLVLANVALNGNGDAPTAGTVQP